MKFRLWYNTGDRKSETWIIEPQDENGTGMTLILAKEVKLLVPCKLALQNVSKTPAGWVEAEGTLTLEGTNAIIE